MNKILELSNRIESAGIAELYSIMRCEPAAQSMFTARRKGYLAIRRTEQLDADQAYLFARQAFGAVNSAIRISEEGL